MPGLRRARAEPPAAAWALAVVSAVLVVVSFVLDVAAPDDGPGIELGPGFGAVYTSAGLAIALCALVVVRADPRQRFGWVLLPVAAVWALDGLSQSYVRFAVRPDDAYVGANLALWFLDRFGAVLPLGIAALLLIFPTGRFLPGWLGRVGVGALAGMVVGVLVVILSPATDVPSVAGLPADIDFDFLTLSPARGSGRGAPAAERGPDRGRGAGRDGHRGRCATDARPVPTGTGCAGWSGPSLVMALTLAVATVADLGSAVDAVIVVVAVLPVVAMTVGVVRPTVVPVENLLVRTLVLGAVASCLLGLDLLVVALLSHTLGGLDQRQLVTVVLLVTALGYGPLRHRLTGSCRPGSWAAAATGTT